jgi:hypothetical protein
MFNMSKKSMMAEAVMPKKRSMMKTSMMITGATLAGVGAYASYKAIKNRNEQNQMNMAFDDDYGYNDFDFDYSPHYDNCHRQHKNDYNELKEKVNEFNNSHKVSSGNKDHNHQHHHENHSGHNFHIKAKEEVEKSDPVKFESKVDNKVESKKNNNAMK